MGKRTLKEMGFKVTKKARKLTPAQRVAQRGAARLIGTAARYYLTKKYGGVGAAAYQAGKYMYDKATQSRSRQKNKSTQTMSRRRYVTTGVYSGKFRSPMKKYVNTRWDRFHKYGVVGVNEAIGNAADPFAIYICNEVANSRDVIYYIAAALIRKVVEMAGGRVTGNNQPVFSTDCGATETAGWVIRMTRQNPVMNTFVNVDHTTVVGGTFESIVLTFRNELEVYCSGFGELNNSNTDEPLWIGVVRDGEIRSKIFFNETFIQLYATSEVKVQNRTLATGGSADAENVNNNPLQGKIYLFNGVPKPKGNQQVVGGTTPSMFTFERMQYPRSVSIFGATSPAGLTVNMREPPPAKQFWNCYKCNNVRLEPGAIKSYYASERRYGNVLKMLKKIRLQLTADGSYSTYSSFKVQMLAFEDVINANAAENISVQYEIERKIGMMVSVKPKKFYTADFFTTT